MSVLYFSSKVQRMFSREHIRCTIIRKVFFRNAPNKKKKILCGKEAADAAGDEEEGGGRGGGNQAFTTIFSAFL